MSDLGGRAVSVAKTIANRLRVTGLNGVDANCGAAMLFDELDRRSPPRNQPDMSRTSSARTRHPSTTCSNCWTNGTSWTPGKGAAAYTKLVTQLTHRSCSSSTKSPGTRRPCRPCSTGDRPRCFATCQGCRRAEWGSLAVKAGDFTPEWRVPRYVYLAMADNRLLLDLDDPDQLAQLPSKDWITPHEALPARAKPGCPGTTGTT